MEASGADAEEVDLLTRALLAELREFPVESAEFSAAGEPPLGAKSAEALALGALVLSLLPKVLPSVVAFLQSWLKRGDGKSIKIKASNGKRSFEVELPSGAFSHEEFNELLATLGATPVDRPAASRKGP